MISKRNFIGLCLGAAVTLTSYGTVFAAEKPVSKYGPTNDIKKFEQRLEEKAKARGISVEELKAKVAERKAKLEKEAKEKGISLEELIKIKKAERKAKLEKEAKEKGITLEELIKQKRENHKLNR